MRKAHRVRRLASVGFSAVVAATACGVGVGAAASTAGAATSGSSGPIVVGGVDAGFNFPGTAQGFEARIARFNKAGGIDGRKIQFLGVTDDQDSPSTELSDIQSLVQDKHVFAVTPVADDVFSSTESTFLQQSKTPAIGDGTATGFCNADWAISINGCQESTAGYESSAQAHQIILAAKKPAKDLRIAMEGYDISSAQIVSKALGEVWQKLGAKVVLNDNNVPLTGTTSYAPYVQAILATHPNVVYEVTGSAAAIALSAALKAAGYDGIIYNGSTYVPSELKTQSSVAQALDGVYSNVLGPSGYDNSPAVKQELKDLKAIGAGSDVEVGTVAGYWSADMLIQLLQATKARGAALTPANVDQTAVQGFTLKPALSGGNGPVTYPAGFNRPMPCTSTVQAQGKTYKLTQKFTCYKDFKVQALASAG